MSFPVKEHLAAQGNALPGDVAQDFEDYQCGRLEHGLHAVNPCAAPLRGSLRLCKSAILLIGLRVCCDSCHAERLVCKRRGFCPSCGVRAPKARAA